MSEGKLIISRTDQYENRRRKIRIHIDGDFTGSVSNGETKEFQLVAGYHQVQARIDWCKTKPQ